MKLSFIPTREEEKWISGKSAISATVSVSCRTLNKIHSVIGAEHVPSLPFPAFQSSQESKKKKKSNQSLIAVAIKRESTHTLRDVPMTKVGFTSCPPSPVPTCLLPSMTGCLHQGARAQKSSGLPGRSPIGSFGDREKVIKS